MSKKEEKIKIKAKVDAALPNGIFKLILENDIEIMGYLSGKIRTNYIRIIPGDDVLVELSPYDVTKGRIIYRY